MDNLNVSASYSATGVSVPETVSKASPEPKDTAAAASKANDSVAAVYEKSSTSAPSKVDKATIEKLKADAEQRTQSLRTLVDKLLKKQSSTFDIAMAVAEGGLSALYENLEVDDATREQAQKDIAEDGYWGVEQTSDRIVSFAKALAGTDPDSAKAMLDAIKEGFKQAEHDWGKKLPDLSQKTMDATTEKMNTWIDSLGKDSTDSTVPAEKPDEAASSTEK